MGDGATDWSKVNRDRADASKRRAQHKSWARSLAKRVEDGGVKAIVGDPVARDIVAAALRQYEPQ